MSDPTDDATLLRVAFHRHPRIRGASVTWTLSIVDEHNAPQPTAGIFFKSELLLASTLEVVAATHQSRVVLPAPSGGHRYRVHAIAAAEASPHSPILEVISAPFSADDPAAVLWVDRLVPIGPGFRLREEYGLSFGATLWNAGYFLAKHVLDAC